MGRNIQLYGLLITMSLTSPGASKRWPLWRVPGRQTAHYLDLSNVNLITNRLRASTSRARRRARALMSILAEKYVMQISSVPH